MPAWSGHDTVSRGCVRPSTVSECDASPTGVEAPPVPVDKPLPTAPSPAPVAPAVDLTSAPADQPAPSTPIYLTRPTLDLEFCQ